MPLEYDVYLDSTKLADLPDGLNDVELSIVREGGVTSDDQVLRLKMETELTFAGDGYAYICSKKLTDYCQDITVRIYLKCDQYSRLAFIGLLPLTGTQALPHKKIVTAKVRDNSYSGLIRERQNNKVFLTATKSATGETITAAPSRVIDFFDSTGTFTFTQRRVWDVFDVMKWLIKQYTNDSVNVVSDAFSLGGDWYHKYAITMGGMLYGGINWTGQNSLPKYFTPQVSFSEVFKEVRKKLRIYMSVDTDVNGVPTVRIEPESYFFSNTQLFDVGDTPVDLLEEYDLEQIYSEVKIGSKDTKVDDGTFYTYPQLLLDSWVEETYNNCSDCVVENTLDLVSEWIIDSNVIHFTLDQGSSTSPPDDDTNVANGDRVFLIETSNTLDRAAVYTLNGESYYNDLLTNRNVFSNWAGGIPQCVAEYIYNLCVNSCAAPYDSGGPVGPTGNLAADFVNDNCDPSNLASETFDFQWGDATTSPITVTRTVTTSGSYFVVPADGYYKFIFSSDITIQGSTGTSPCGLVALVFPDSTHLTTGADESGNELFRYYDYESFTNETKTITVEVSGTFSNGNVIAFLLIFGGATVNNVAASNTCLELEYYSIPDAFSFVSDDFLRKPVKWTLTHPVCETDFIEALTDKRGYITVNGQRGWIKQLDYAPMKKSTLTLQSTTSICC